MLELLSIVTGLQKLVMVKPPTVSNREKSFLLGLDQVNP
jgi:hypothetical protein